MLEFTGLLCYQRHVLSGEQILFLCNIDLFKTINKTRIGCQGNHSVLLERIMFEEKTFKEIMFAFHMLSIISFTVLITSAIAVL